MTHSAKYEYHVFPATFDVILRKVDYLWDSVGPHVSHLHDGPGSHPRAAAARVPAPGERQHEAPLLQAAARDHQPRPAPLQQGHKLKTFR